MDGVKIEMQNKSLNILQSNTNDDKNEAEYVDIENELKLDLKDLKDAEVQCILAECGYKLPQHFTIMDIRERRQLVRKLYGLLIFQQLLVIAAIEVFLDINSKAFSIRKYAIAWVAMALVNILTYFISEQRRRSPLNYLFFLMVTALYITEEMFYAQTVHSHLVLIQPVFLIFQLTFLMLVTKQQYIRFTNGRGIILTFLIFSLYLCCLVIWTAETVLPILARSFGYGCYLIYDTHVILTGQHGYQIKPDEYIFAATNIIADYTIILWRIFKFIFLQHLIVCVKFLFRCCKSEVC